MVPWTAGNIQQYSKQKLYHTQILLLQTCKKCAVTLSLLPDILTLGLQIVPWTAGHIQQYSKQNTNRYCLGSGQYMVLLTKATLYINPVSTLSSIYPPYTQIIIRLLCHDVPPPPPKRYTRVMAKSKR